MAKELQLIYRSDDGEQASDNTADLQRILNLAGVTVASNPVDHSIDRLDAQGCESCGSHEHTSDACPHAVPVQMTQHDGMEGLEEEQAEYDHGSQDNEAEGHEVNPDTYIWNGAKLPQRIVKGSQGDNPLISELHSQLLQKYTEFLTEDENRENDDGTLSPLSDPTKPEFDKDPLSGEEPVTDGSHSPMSTIARQDALK